MLYEELGGRGFVVVAVALDRSPDDARPWIEAARPTYPALIDTHHVVADLYNVVNVPTIFWIDERGRIVRPNDVAFGSDTFKNLTGLSSALNAAPSPRTQARSPSRCRADESPVRFLNVSEPKATSLGRTMRPRSSIQKIVGTLTTL